MAGTPVATSLKLKDYERLQKAIEQRGLTLYSFVRDAILEKMQREGI